MFGDFFRDDEGGNFFKTRGTTPTPVQHLRHKSRGNFSFPQSTTFFTSNTLSG